jgi:pilus assembly protein CpaB
MSRNTRTFVVLTVATVVAAVASFGVYAAIRSIPERRVEIATRHTVVAATAMPIGTLVTRDSVKLVPWPAQTPLQGGFATVEEVVDRGLIAGVVENEPLTENKLAAKEAGAGLPPTITPGMRAISVKVNEVIGVAGFVVPGTRVDVVTVISREENREDTLSRVVVSNVQVLSAGTRYDQEEPKKDGKAIRSTVVTLMVSPVDAERVALAQAEGQLMLTLRNPLDVDPSNTLGIRRANLFTGETAPPAAAPQSPRPQGRRAAAPAPAPAPVVVAAAPRIHTVETIRAAKRTEEVVGQ